MVIETPFHALAQKAQAITRSELRRYEDIRLPSENVYGCEGKQIAKVDTIHLDDLPRAGGLWYRSPGMVLLPPGTNYVLLGQDILALGH